MTAVAAKPAAAPAQPLGRPWWMTLILGIAAIIIGGLLLFGSLGTQLRTYQMLIVLIGIWWLVDGIMNIVHIFFDHRQWGWKLFMGIIGILAGGWILIYPVYAGIALPQIFVLVLGIWGLIEGITLLFLAFRGGGWMDSTTTMRAAMRNGTDPNTKINWMGFRCARDVQDKGAQAAAVSAPAGN